MMPSTPRLGITSLPKEPVRRVMPRVQGAVRAMVNRPDFTDLKGQPVGLATAIAIERVVVWLEERLAAIEARLPNPPPVEVK
jgi:glutathione S-transferase